MEFMLQQVVCAALGALSWFLGIRRIQAQTDGRRNLVACLAGLETIVAAIPVFIGATQGTFVPVISEALGAFVGARMGMVMRK